MIHRLKEVLRKQGIDGIIVSCSYNISYLADSKIRDAYLLVSEKGSVCWTDSRYIEEVKRMDSFSRQGIEARIASQGNPVFDSISECCGNWRIEKLGFEAGHLSFKGYQRLKDRLDGIAELIPTYEAVEGLRRIKTRDELDRIKQAARITAEALRFIKDFIRPGKKEAEISGELERFIRYNGADGAGFDIIVASGINSGFPHYGSANRVIQDNEAVLVDIGAEYCGYKSDLTRVFFLGKINPLIRKIYRIVIEAQQRAIDRIKPGVAASEIDRVSRCYIERKGYGRFFSHSLGHGVGLEIHELPEISRRAKPVLKEGMVFTVEPAIYLPGRFGIRIEDMVVVTKKGVEVISGALDK